MRPRRVHLAGSTSVPDSVVSRPAVVMDELVAQCEAAGEAVKTAKAGGDKAAIKAAVDALVAIKTKITALDPSHPMALVDKAAKKKAEKEAKKKQEAAAPAADGGAAPSKNAQKAAA